MEGYIGKQKKKKKEISHIQEPRGLTPWEKVGLNWDFGGSHQKCYINIESQH